MENVADDPEGVPPDHIFPPMSERERRRLHLDQQELGALIADTAKYAEQAHRQIVDFAASAAQVTPVIPANIPPYLPRPEIGLLRDLLGGQMEQTAAAARMADGIGTLARHAVAESRRTRWILVSSLLVVALTSVLVILTIELLSRTK